MIGTLGNQSLAMSNETYIEVGSPEHKEIWMSRLREVSSCQHLFSFTYVAFQEPLILSIIRYISGVRRGLVVSVLTANQ